MIYYDEHATHEVGWFIRRRARRDMPRVLFPCRLLMRVFHTRQQARDHVPAMRLREGETVDIFHGEMVITPLEEVEPC